MSEQNLNILERIHTSYYQLTATEKRLADYVLSHNTQVQFMSITQLADECSTTEASVSRFCRSLKLKGFNAFKIEIARHIAMASVPEGETLPSANMDTLEGRCQEIKRQSIEAVTHTIELVNSKDVAQVIALIEKANRVLCMGSGGSTIMAGECAHLFSTVTNKFQKVVDFHMQLSSVATMDAHDILILFSYSGSTKEGIEILRLARSRNIATVLMTRFSKSPAAKLAAVTLCCGSNESPVQAGSIAACVAQLVLIDVLYREYCQRNKESSTEAIQKTLSALSGEHI